MWRAVNGPSMRLNMYQRPPLPSHTIASSSVIASRQSDCLHMASSSTYLVGQHDCTCSCWLTNQAPTSPHPAQRFNAAYDMPHCAHAFCCCRLPHAWLDRGGSTATPSAASAALNAATLLASLQAPLQAPVLCRQPQEGLETAVGTCRQLPHPRCH